MVTQDEAKAFVESLNRALPMGTKALTGRWEEMFPDVRRGVMDALQGFLDSRPRPKSRRLMPLAPGGNDPPPLPPPPDPDLGGLTPAEGEKP